MDNCVFCRIAKKEIPAHIVYEDAKYLAFLDIHPHAIGHVQVIPKEHYRWVWDTPNTGEYFEVAKKMAKAQMKAFNTEWILSKIMGDEVPHAHIWVFPSKNVPGNKEDFAGNAEKIRGALK